LEEAVDLSSDRLLMMMMMMMYHPVPDKPCLKVAGPRNQRNAHCHHAKLEPYQIMSDTTGWSIYSDLF
jgi:hypothetical protein